MKSEKRIVIGFAAAKEVCRMNSQIFTREAEGRSPDISVDESAKLFKPISHGRDRMICVMSKNDTQRMNNEKRKAKS
jgi:hypothetical protein